MRIEDRFSVILIAGSSAHRKCLSTRDRFNLNFSSYFPGTVARRRSSSCRGRASRSRENSHSYAVQSVFSSRWNLWRRSCDADQLRRRRRYIRCQLRTDARNTGCDVEIRSWRGREEREPDVCCLIWPGRRRKREHCVVDQEERGHESHPNVLVEL